MNEQFTLFADNAEYDAFVNKFQHRKTTDDCYTPPLVYDAVKDWACVKYGIDPDSIVRPFFPGGDYENYIYPEGCVVLDNPPFSILSRICEFYLDRGIPFFLFAPSTTAFSARSVAMRINHIICNSKIVYDNGVAVTTSFVTSFGGDVVAQTAPDLTRKINRAVLMVRCGRECTKSLPKYNYPDAVVTAGQLQKYAGYGVQWEIRRKDCTAISRLDAQRDFGKTIFGGGLLLSEAQAQKHRDIKRAAAERAADHVWELSPREIEIVKCLGNVNEGEAAEKVQPVEERIWLD